MYVWRKVTFTCFALFSLLYSQDLSDWQIITCMNDVNAVASHGEYIWVGTTGGVYRLNRSNGAIDQFTNLDGLASLGINAITADTRYQRMLAGSEDGIIHTCIVDGDTWRPYFELQGQRIRNLHINNDTLWVSTDNGVGVFLNRAQGLEFRDFYNNMPVNPERGAEITVFKNRVFYATIKGLLYAPSDFVRHNLKIAQAWTHITTASGLPSDDVRALAASPDSLYIGTIAGPVWLDSELMVRNMENWSSGGVFNIAWSPSVLYFANDQSYYMRSGSSWLFQQNLPDFINALELDDQGGIWAGVRDGGLKKDLWEKPLLLEGPASNHVGNLIKDSRGRLWMASGKIKLTFDRGFYRFENGKWTNYYFSGAWFRKNFTDVVYEDMYGNIWLGAWGGGATMIRQDETFDFYHYWPEDGTLTISDIQGDEIINLPGIPAEKRRCFINANVSGDDVYTVITQFGEDRSQNFWVANFLAREPEYMAAIQDRTDIGLSDCSDWMYFGANIGMSQDDGQVTALTFEDIGETELIWMGTFGRGILVLNHKNTIDNPADDELYRLTMSSDNLFSNIILSMARDLDGIIWIGTDAGLNSYQPDPSGVNRRIFKHVGQIGPIENKINQIFVDEYNNKWFATDGGLSVLMADRSPWDTGSWEHYTPQNSGLPDKIVNSIYVDARTGKAYIGTESGLAIFSGPFSEYRNDMSNIASGPNPFVVDGTNRFIIRNLAFNSRVKIFNLSGVLIRELNADDGAIEGSRAVWDGRDSRYNSVASGIYIYLAYNDEGMNGSGKIAVIRR